MKTTNKFWWFTVVSVAFTLLVIFSLALLFWQQLAANEKALLYSLFKQHFLYIFTAAFLLLAGAGFALDGIFRLYIIPISRLTEQVTLMSLVNPSHRVGLEGSKDIINLAKTLNEIADRYEMMQNDIQNQIGLAKAEAEEEKNILAAILAELPEGVVICNQAGRILLYNRQAKQLLGEGENTALQEEVPPAMLAGRFMGLGRSIFGVINKHLVVHALDDIMDKLKRDEANVVSYFVLANKENHLLRVEIVPILNHVRRFSGFFLVLYDITQELETDSRQELFLQSLARGIRASSASIRAAIEAILEYPQMNSDQLQQFRQIIHTESIALGKLIDNTAIDFARSDRTRWPLVQMRAADLAVTIKQKAEEKLGIQVHIQSKDNHSWIKVDRYSLVLAALFVIVKLKDTLGKSEFRFRLERKGSFMNLDLLWRGEPIKIDTLRDWDGKVLIVEKEGISLTLKEIIGHHGAEIWSYSCRREPDQSYLRLLIPAYDDSEASEIRNVTILPESRPAFYDFDLFNQPGQIPELDSRPLKELSYTVFDTETTGLDPNGGDEIISIGGVRIVNLRILRDEKFDRLINPMRPLSSESIKIHGIQPEMLKDQPTLDQVLPSFHRFAEDTILIAHNAAFDMRMLQLKEASTGVKFINPVLDTMLLSAVVHPAHKNHNLEAIAGRFGINIIGRHSALGDAMATAEMFLKLIPLLIEKDITTLKEARLASQKTYYARLKY